MNSTVTPLSLYELSYQFLVCCNLLLLCLGSVVMLCMAIPSKETLAPKQRPIDARHRAGMRWNPERGYDRA